MKEYITQIKFAFRTMENNHQMNPETEKVYKELLQQAIKITEIFNLFRFLFGNRENIDLFNRTSPFVFFHFHRALLDSIILKIAKFTDPEKIGGYLNLSSDYLIQLLKDEDSPITSQLEKSIEEINTLLPGLRDIRNKYIAHTDQKASLKDLPGLIKNLKIDHSIEELEKFINIISCYYEETQYFLDNYPPEGDGGKFVRYLQIGADTSNLVRYIVGFRD